MATAQSAHSKHLDLHPCSVCYALVANIASARVALAAVKERLHIYTQRRPSQGYLRADGLAREHTALSLAPVQKEMTLNYRRYHTNTIKHR